jgi:hypothetical protein
MNELVRKDAHAVVMTSHTDVIPLRPRNRERRYFAGAVAAVACITLVAGLRTLIHVDERAGATYPVHVPASISMPEVNAKAAGDVVVMRTNNPSITVIWYLSPRRGKS